MNFKILDPDDPVLPPLTEDEVTELLSDVHVSEREQLAKIWNETPRIMRPKLRLRLGSAAIDVALLTQRAREQKGEKK